MSHRDGILEKLDRMGELYADLEAENARLQAQIDTATTTGLRVMKERDGYKALAERRGEALKNLLAAVEQLGIFPDGIVAREARAALAAAPELTT